MNENYQHPAMPEGAEQGIVKGHVPLREGREAAATSASADVGSGTILREAMRGRGAAARPTSASTADIWSVTSFTELAREAQDVERWNRLHPTRRAEEPYVTETAWRRRPGR